MPERLRTPLATQFRATPPAITSARSPVRSTAARARPSTISSVTTCTEAAKSQWRCSSSLSASRIGAPNSSSKARPTMRLPWWNSKYFMFSVNEPSGRTLTSSRRMMSANRGSP